MTYDTFEALFNSIDRSLEISTITISNKIRDMWKLLVYKNFYQAYPNPIEYDRSMDTLNSITVINVSKTKKGIIASIGYDISLINPFTYSGLSTGMERQGHTQPELQPQFVEHGFSYKFGNIEGEREGSGAFEQMLKLVTSQEFVNMFERELIKMGYTFIK